MNQFRLLPAASVTPIVQKAFGTTIVEVVTACTIVVLVACFFIETGTHRMYRYLPYPGQV
ncbi:MAG: hypothetical protein U5K84_10360 [Alkalibacterium sp.]|nr:hypothetical protein [Alkalibacterium sp.]